MNINEQEIQTFIEQAVRSAYHAGMQDSKKLAKKYYKQTEARLHAYPLLKRNVEKYRRDISDLQREPLNARSKDFVRYSLGGVRLTPEEIHEARILNVQVRLERDCKELAEIDDALAVCVAGDAYAEVISLKYFDGKSDECVAEHLHCDPSTVRRNKSRLVRKLTVYFYGADAI